MKTIRIKFLKSTHNMHRQSILNWLNNFNVIEDDENYDYVFFVEGQYINPADIKELLSTKQEAIRIFICGEALYPDLNLCDYATCFEPNYKCEDRVINYPYELLYENNSILDIPKKDFEPKEILKTKTKFCNFIYGNPDAHPMRDKIFWALSEYKKVDSLGKHLNNVKIENTREAANWVEILINLKSTYKFSIAAENSNMKGYTTEKIMTSMIAQTIPIYFGNPYINELYNPKSFINASDFETLDDLVEYVKKVDNDDDLWCQIMSEPWQTDEQKEKIQGKIKDFHKKFDAIFEQDIKAARRRADGFWVNLSNERIFKPMEEKKSINFMGIKINLKIRKLYAILHSLSAK